MKYLVCTGHNQSIFPILIHLILTLKPVLSTFDRLENGGTDRLNSYGINQGSLAPNSGILTTYYIAS